MSGPRFVRLLALVGDTITPYVVATDRIVTASAATPSATVPDLVHVELEGRQYALRCPCAPNGYPDPSAMLDALGRLIGAAELPAPTDPDEEPF